MNARISRLAGQWIREMIVLWILVLISSAGAVNPPQYGYWDTPLHGRHFDHVSFFTVNPTVRDIERVLLTDRKIVIHAFQIYNRSDVLDNLRKVKTVMDQIGSRLNNRVLYVSIAHEQHSNIAYWQNIISQAHAIFGPGVKLAMNFGSGYTGDVPAGLDVYDMQFYTTGWESSQGELDANADSLFTDFRAKIVAANGEARQIMVTGRGWMDRMGPDVPATYPGFLVDWVQRQSDVIGINWWLYAQNGESSLKGVMDMPGFAVAVRTEGLTFGYGFTPMRNLLDNSDLEYDRTQTAGNLVPNSSFETPNDTGTKPIDWVFQENPPSLDPNYITDGTHAYDGTDCLFWSWATGGPYMNGIEINLPVSGGARYKFSDYFRRDESDGGSEARMSLRAYWRAGGKEIGTDAVFTDHLSRSWEKEVLTTQAPYQADGCRLVLSTAQFELSESPNDAIGWWDKIGAYVLKPATPSRNLITNGGFERNEQGPNAPPDGWSGTVPLPVCDTSGLATWQGTAAMYTAWDRNPGNYTNGINSAAIEGLEPGQSYTVSAYWKNDVNSGSAARLGYSVDGDPDDTSRPGFHVIFSGPGVFQEYAQVFTASGSGWQRLVYTLPPAPTGATHAYVRLNTYSWEISDNNDPSADTYGWWDAVQFEKTNIDTTLTRIMYDNFSGDLSQWNLDYLRSLSNSVSINAQKQLVIDSGSMSNNRGFLLTKLQLPSSADLAAKVSANQVGLSVRFDVVSTTSQHAGGLLFGAKVTSDDRAGGTKLYDALCGDTDGVNDLYNWYGGPAGNFYYSDAGPNGYITGNAWNNGTGAGNIGHNVRIDWLKNSSNLGSLDHGIIYIDGVQQSGSYLQYPDFQAGALGFYLLLDRDAVIDNFEVWTAPSACTEWVSDAYETELDESAGTYPEYWTRTGNSPLFAKSAGQANASQSSLLMAYIPNTMDAGSLVTTAPTSQGPIFTEGAARGSATDYTLSAYCKVASTDADGSARVRLRIRAYDWNVTLQKADIAQTFDLTIGDWQRITLTANLPANSWYAYATLEAVDPAAGAGDSVVYVDSLQFEQAGSASEYQAIPSPVPGDVNGDGIVNSSDLTLLLAALDSLPPSDSRADLDSDNEVTSSDLAIVLANMQ